MRSRTRIAAATTLVTAVLAVGAAVATNPYLLVRAQFERQRVNAGLGEAEGPVADHRWVYALSDAAPAGAPTRVMLHGFTGSKENWYPLAERLRGRYRLLIPDLPGGGESERQPGADYGFVAQAGRVAAFIERVARRPGPQRGEIVLLGHSMGGDIAALTAARYPQLVDRVGLFDGAGVHFRDNPFGRDVLAGNNPFSVDDRDSLRRYIDTVFPRDGAKPWTPWPASSGLIAYRRDAAAFEQAVLDRIGRGPERFAPGVAAADIGQPALLLWGRQDSVIDASAMDLYAEQMPQTTTVLLDDCGHMCRMEPPAAVAAAVTLMIQRGLPR